MLPWPGGDTEGKDILMTIHFQAEIDDPARTVRLWTKNAMPDGAGWMSPEKRAEMGQEYKSAKELFRRRREEISEFEEGTKRLEDYRAHLPWWIKLSCAANLHNWGLVCDVRPWTRTNLNSIFVMEC